MPRPARYSDLVLFRCCFEKKMVKRNHEESEDAGSNKRLRCHPRDRLSALSDELLLVLLSYLPVHDLTRCEQYVSDHLSGRTR